MYQTIFSRFQHEEGDQIFICTVPMFHIYGLAAFAMGMLASGSTKEGGGGGGGGRGEGRCNG